MIDVRSILKSPLFRVTSLNSVSVLVRMLGGLLASKMVALFVGPAGFALVGNLRNFLTSLDYFSIMGFQNGIIKYTAENQEDPNRLFRVLATVFIAIFFVILVISGALFILSHHWGEWVFGSGRYSWIFKLLAFSMPWYAGNLVFMAILNGLGRYRQVITINIWANAIGVILSAVLMWKLGVTGAFLGLILNPALLFIGSFYIVYRSFPRFPFLKKLYFDRTILNGLLSYGVMSLVSAILNPIVYLSIRNNLIDNVSSEEAGFWEAMNRISGFYLMFVSTLLTLHFLPGLSKAKNGAETRDVMKSYFKAIVPIFCVGLVVVYLLRDFIIRLLFSKDFMPMENLFFWQLLGDYFKVCSLILGYELVAKKQTPLYIGTEVMSYALLFLSSEHLIAQFGSEGAVIAHAATYFMYLLVLGIYFLKKLNRKEEGMD